MAYPDPATVETIDKLIYVTFTTIPMEAAFEM